MAKRTQFTVEAKEVESIAKFIEQYGAGAREIINDCFKEIAAPEVEKAIYQFMPVSGRKFKGHQTGAKASNSLQTTLGNLQFTVSAKSKFSYLYFPDDGSTTKRHIGNQHFFSRGGNFAIKKFLPQIEEKLVEKFERT